MALKLNKLFVRVPGNVTVADISAVSVQEDNQKKLYFLENLHQIVNNGIAYGVDPDTVSDITDLQTLVGAKSISDSSANGKSVIERLQALEAIKVKAGDTYNDSSYITVTKDASNIPVIDLNIVAIDGNENGLVDAVNARTYIDTKAKAATTVVEAGKGVDVKSTTANDGHTIYTIDSSLTLTYTSATSGENAQPAKINLVDGTNVFGSINVSDIIGNGVLQSSDYDPSTGKLTLTFKNASGSTTTAEIDLHEMLDINDMSVETGSQKYLTVALSGSASEDGNSQAVFTVHTVDVSTVTEQTTALADAWLVKLYVDSKVSDKNVSATGDNYVSANAANNEVTITTDVQDLTASAGTRGTYTVADDGTVTLSGETAPSISGVTQSLVDGADVATKVATYVDAKVAAEAARTNANIEGAIKALDSNASNTGNNVTVGVTEVDGKITTVSVSEAYATVDSSLGVTANAGLVKGSDIEKVKTYVDKVAQDLSIGITGDNYITATRGDNKNYTITADVVDLTLTTGGNSDSTLAGTKNSLVDSADAAEKVSQFVNARIREEVAKLDSNTSATNTYVTTSVTEADGVLTDSSVTLTFGTMNGTDPTANTSNGIAKAEDVQDFVDTYNFWETYQASNNNGGN